MTALALALLVTAARADDVLPSYAEQVVIQAWRELDAGITAACDWPPGREGLGAPLSCRADALDALVARADAFVRQVRDDARIHVLVGLARRHQGDLRAAARAQRRAVELDPDRADAWWELGELAELADDWTGAEAAFREVVRLVPEGPRAAPGWFKLAQAAGHRGDAEALETNLRAALRFGFSFEDVAGQPAWRTFAADPRLRETLERLLVVHADEPTRRSLLDP